ncbi:MAG: replicative DNA helicase [Rhodospirillaceae bacterium]
MSINSPPPNNPDSTYHPGSAYQNVVTEDAHSEFPMQPHNEEAEQALLGALLVSNRAYEKVSEFLLHEHFYSPAHGRIFAHISSLIERGMPADPVTMKAYFQNDADLVAVGGTAYINELASCAVTIVNAEDYGRAIHSSYIRRQLIAIGEDMLNQAYRHDIKITAQDQIEDAEKHLFDLATKGDIRGGFQPISVGLKAAIDTAGVAYRRTSHTTGVTTGLQDLDLKLGGLHKSDLIILAGRPSMGKTALATNIAVNAAKEYLRTGGTDGAAVGIFSLEMSGEQLANRVLADEIKISSDKIRRGDLKESNFPDFLEALQNLSRLSLFIDDSPAITVGTLRSRARRLKRSANLGLIVIDYLQLMRGGGINRSENRVQEISEITRGLKAVAKELEIPVLALSQLSRAVETREDKRPMLSDLRESGSIEQDADVVMFVYREQYYLERTIPSRRPDETEERFNERHAVWMKMSENAYGIAECIIAKQRHGPIGTVTMRFDGKFTKFTDIDSIPEPDYDNDSDRPPYRQPYRAPYPTPVPAYD